MQRLNRWRLTLSCPLHCARLYSIVVCFPSFGAIRELTEKQGEKNLMKVLIFFSYSHEWFRVLQWKWKILFPAQFWYRFYMVFFCCCYCWLFWRSTGTVTTTTNEWGCSHVKMGRNRVAFNSRRVFLLPKSSSLSAHFNGAECLFAVFMERWYLLVSYSQLFNWYLEIHIWDFLKKIHAHSFCGIFTVYLTEI